MRASKVIHETGSRFLHTRLEVGDPDPERYERGSYLRRKKKDVRGQQVDRINTMMMTMMILVDSGVYVWMCLCAPQPGCSVRESEGTPLHPGMRVRRRGRRRRRRSREGRGRTKGNEESRGRLSYSHSLSRNRATSSFSLLFIDHLPPSVFYFPTIILLLLLFLLLSLHLHLSFSLSLSVYSPYFLPFPSLPSAPYPTPSASLIPCSLFRKR